MKNQILLTTIAVSLIAVNCMAQTVNKPETVTDIDGNVYSTVQIGTQTWTSQNLRTITLNDGTPISFVEDKTSWNSLITPGVCFFNNWIHAGFSAQEIIDAVNNEKIDTKSNFTNGGALYNGYAVNTEKLAPKGWHVASDADWICLQEYLGGASFARTQLVSEKIGFNGYNCGKRDANGFSEKKNAFWWSSTEVSKHHNVYFEIEENFMSLYSDISNINNGFSVRLVKDDSISNSTSQTEANRSIYNTEITKGSVTDIDSNSYSTIRLGKQVWMAENLRTTKYRNGELIGTTKSLKKNISKETSPKYQWAYEGNEANAAIYGRLYTGYAATDIRNIAPEGWHVPTKWDFRLLEFYLRANGYCFEEEKDTTTNIYKPIIAKSLSSKTNWASSNIKGSAGNTDYPEKRNSTGFNALPAGFRFSSFGSGEFLYRGGGAYFWSVSESGAAYCTGYHIFSNEAFAVAESSDKREGFSIRCIKD